MVDFLLNSSKRSRPPRTISHPGSALNIVRPNGTYARLERPAISNVSLVGAALGIRCAYAVNVNHGARSRGYRPGTRTCQAENGRLTYGSFALASVLALIFSSIGKDVKKMNLPGFTAEASLYTKSKRSQARKIKGQAGHAFEQSVLPARITDTCTLHYLRCGTNRCDRNPIKDESPRECEEYCWDQYLMCNERVPIEIECISNWGCRWWQVCMGYQCVDKRVR